MSAQNRVAGTKHNNNASLIFLPLPVADTRCDCLASARLAPSSAAKRGATPQPCKQRGLWETPANALSYRRWQNSEAVTANASSVTESAGSARGILGTDRKSTRLNSSHLVIS